MYFITYVSKTLKFKFCRLTAKKEAQERRLKERLEEMKRKKERTMCESLEPSDRLQDFERF